MVYFTPIDLWVHDGPNGFGDAYIKKELDGLGYYSFPTDREVDVVVDVGGHIGCYTREVAKRAKRVIFVEPHPENVEIARKNFDWWGLTNIEIVQAAVTYENDVVFHPYLPDHNSGGSQLLSRGVVPFPNDCVHGQPFEVPTMTLEQLTKKFKVKRIDILKLDCEGSEYSILSKAKWSLLSSVNQVVGEWHKVSGMPRFDEFCKRQLPVWHLEVSKDNGGLDAPLGYFILSPPKTKVRK